MSVGTSGRVVLEIEPMLKRELYAALSLEGKTLKGWFVAQATNFLADAGQLSLSLERKDGASDDRLT
jgi:hypothetical protein